MDNLAHSEIFALTLVIGTYLTSLALYKKVHISLLHPLLTTIFVIIVVLRLERHGIMENGCLTSRAGDASIFF